jgi:hypothetical protein
MPEPEPHAVRRGSQEISYPDPEAIRTREVVVVRRRRRKSRSWVPHSSMRRRLLLGAVCAGALLLMVAGLYFGLSATG